MSKRMRHAEMAANQNEWVKECWFNAKHAAKELGATPEFLAAMDPDEEAMKYTISRLLEQEDGKRTSIPQFMVDEGLDWSSYAAWIEVSPKRKAAWESLKKDRNFFARESLLHGWWQTAGMKPDSAVTHGDVSKARDSIAKAEGIFKQVVEHSGKEDGAPITFATIERVIVDPK